jgi:STE24 endopeptidase
MNISLADGFHIYFFARVIQYGAERILALSNYRYSRNSAHLEHARKILGLREDDLEKSLAYSEDRFRFATVFNALSLFLTLGFLSYSGLGYVEKWAFILAGGIGRAHEVVVGLWFFGILAGLSLILSLPASYYQTFYIEEKHGFNKQTQKQFFIDQLKALILGVLLGGPILALVLWIMKALGSYWWIYAWVFLSLVSILTAWIYPTLLAPLFNKFSPLEPGSLKEAIDDLAVKTGFRSDGVFLMDASKRSGHGNAYFTGIFGKKRIVLFDTLVQMLKPQEIVAVLAHELGHFKLKHVFWGLLRGLSQSAVVFYLLSLCLPLEPVYTSFGLAGRSDYGALVIFGSFFGIVEFLLQPIENFLSRKNEFAADQFALQFAKDKNDLPVALLKLRENSRSMPISHPLYSKMYYTHPPLLERLEAMGYQASQEAPAS